MSNEELHQRGYLASGRLRGTPFGSFEELNIGGTTVAELVRSGVTATPPNVVAYPFTSYKAPKRPVAARPDRVFLRRKNGDLVPVAVAEHKAPARLRSAAEALRAAEQGVFSAVAVGAPIAITTNGQRCLYINVPASVEAGRVVYFNEDRDLNPAVLHNLVHGDAGVVKDPKPLAERVWQIIWHATKEEPKSCLLTFVEMFLLKFLSDNLPTSHLPQAYRFYELLTDPAEFEKRHGKTAIEYYIATIRPQIKKLFPDNVLVQDPAIPKLFGLRTIVSKTSIINGFAFLRSSDQTLASFNRTFREVLTAFHDFGPLTTIDPEFKLRLYETFLKRSARQQTLGQFFTPRNIVKSMIRMARLSRLPDGAVVLDPAAGVGGFVLEPLLLPDSLAGNITFDRGKTARRVRTLGVDVDPNLHILAKANMLIHLAEVARDPSVTIDALNQAMAETFVLMNQHETLGALENPVHDAADVILTNPPYVTQGSRVYRDEIETLNGTRNGLDLRDYFRGGLGLESLFLRYISGALKSGGHAYMIVPLGLLTRTDPGLKPRLLEECDVIASIELPRNAFFNTAQPTYILALHKRHTKSDRRPPVFCAIARTIGESLDYERVPTPAENDLEEIATLFVKFMDGEEEPARTSPLVKIADADTFDVRDRWDVRRFWSDEELIALGCREQPVRRLDFIEQVRERIGAISTDLAAARAELAQLTSGPTKTVPLSDERCFVVRAGKRITNQNVRENPGNVPIFSCFTDPTTNKGEIDEQWLASHNIPIESEPLVTIMANGAAAVGLVFVRRERCVLTDDVIIVQPRSPLLDVDYVASELRSRIEMENFTYEAKLFTGRVRRLSVAVPVTASGDFDLEQQKAIASAIGRFEAARRELFGLGEWTKSARIS